jgi:hypothetical protein
LGCSVRWWAPLRRTAPERLAQAASPPMPACRWVAHRHQPGGAWGTSGGLCSDAKAALVHALLGRQICRGLGLGSPHRFLQPLRMAGNILRRAFAGPIPCAASPKLGPAAACRAAVYPSRADAKTSPGEGVLAMSGAKLRPQESQPDGAGRHRTADWPQRASRKRTASGPRGGGRLAGGRLGCEGRRIASGAAERQGRAAARPPLRATRLSAPRPSHRQQPRQARQAPVYREALALPKPGSR